MKERILASVDRESEGILVLYTIPLGEEDPKEIHLDQKLYPSLHSGDYVWLEYENQYLVWVIKDEGKTQKRKVKIYMFWKALLQKKRKNK